MSISTQIMRDRLLSSEKRKRKEKKKTKKKTSQSNRKVAGNLGKTPIQQNISILRVPARKQDTDTMQ